MKSLKELEADVDERIFELCEAFRNRSARTGKEIDFSEYTR